MQPAHNQQQQAGGGAGGVAGMELVGVGFPHDHAYACRGRSAEPAHTRLAHGAHAHAHGTLAAHALHQDNSKSLAERLKQSQQENEKLKSLMLVHLDLIQRQSERIVSKEKVLAALRRERALLKAQVRRAERLAASSPSASGPPDTLDDPQPELERGSSPSIRKMAPKQPLGAPVAIAKPIGAKLRGNGKIGSQFYKSRNAMNSLLLPCGGEADPDDVKPEGDLMVNKKSSIIHTYGKKLSGKPLCSESSSDRIKLTDSTPVDDDPYQLREADMREQSPIPKLMLQKNNPAKIKIFTDDHAIVEMKPSYDSDGLKEADMTIHKIKLNKYNLGTPYMFPGENDDENSNGDNERCSDSAKHSDPTLANIKEEKVEASCRDFSYGESSRNLTAEVSFDTERFGSLFSDPYVPQTDDKSGAIFQLADAKLVTEKKRNRSRSSISVSESTSAGVDNNNVKSTPGNKRWKRTAQKNGIDSTKNKLTDTPSISETPPLTTKEPFYISVGLGSSWNDDANPECNEPTKSLSSSECLEVPSWREKPYTSVYSMEGTENLDDDIFNKRHQKQETNEMRRKRWDVQRLREQRRLERLRKRQRDGPGYSNGHRYPDNEASLIHTFQPEPHLHAQYIEVADTIPLSAFGEIVPALPECEFVLPWIRVSKRFKRSKNSTSKSRKSLIPKVM